jgi:hypothetical protein
MARPSSAAAPVDPVLAAFDNAPLSDEPETDEERAADMAAIAEHQAGRGRGRSHAEVHADVERAAQAMRRFGAEGEHADITLGEVLRWQDTGEASPGIAALIAGEGRAAAAE